MESNKLKSYILFFIVLFCSLILNSIDFLLDKNITLNIYVLYLMFIVSSICITLEFICFAVGLVYVFKPDDEYEFNKLY
jgi:hypothetical protein